jgi:hypothetical protein
VLMSLICTCHILIDRADVNEAYVLKMISLTAFAVLLIHYFQHIDFMKRRVAIHYGISIAVPFQFALLDLILDVKLLVRTFHSILSSSLTHLLLDCLMLSIYSSLY